MKFSILAFGFSIAGRGNANLQKHFPRARASTGGGSFPNKTPRDAMTLNKCQDRGE
jgi:hypothetical protein